MKRSRYICWYANKNKDFGININADSHDVASEKFMQRMQEEGQNPCVSDGQIRTVCVQEFGDSEVKKFRVEASFEINFEAYEV